MVDGVAMYITIDSEIIVSYCASTMLGITVIILSISIYSDPGEAQQVCPQSQGASLNRSRVPMHQDKIG